MATTPRRLTAQRQRLSPAYRCAFCGGRPSVLVADGLTAVSLCRLHEAELARLLTRPETTAPVPHKKTGAV